MNYVEFYKESTGLFFNSNVYDVHHINEDRKDNSIKNLVMIPKYIHSQYHILKNNLPSFGINTKVVSLIDMGNGHNSLYINSIVSFDECLKICNMWCDYKEFLLGRLPNIHRIYFDNNGIRIYSSEKENINGRT